MTALTTRDALAKALCRWWDDEDGGDDLGHGAVEFPCRHCLAVADALLASGAVIDVATLADDEAAEAAFWREQEAGNTMRDRGGYFHAGFIAGFRALAAALTERGAQ